MSESKQELDMVIEPGVVELRVTITFRREGNGWRVVHRHADSITAQRAPEE